MPLFRQFLFATAALSLAHAAVAQTSAPASAPAAAPTTQTSNDPFVEKRNADKAAKEEYKARRKAAKEQSKTEKKAAKQELKEKRHEAAEKRKEELSNQPKSIPQTPG